MVAELPKTGEGVDIPPLSAFFLSFSEPTGSDFFLVTIETLTSAGLNFPKSFRHAGVLCYNASPMSGKYLRVYQEFDIHEVKQHILIYGDLAANCGNCPALNVPLDAAACPECQTPFKYIAFRNIKHHLPKLTKLRAARPEVVLVDHDDFKRVLGAAKAEEFLK